MPTLSDIAKIAGVGVMSVSRVVNGSRKVSPETERKVRAAIERIGYQANEAARMLKGQRSRLLGLIVPDLSDPFFATCANTVHETAWESGYMTLMAASAHREDIERSEVEVMAQRQIAGLIVIPSSSANEHFAKLQRKGVPIVSLDRPLDNVEADALLVDNREAAAGATAHLVDHGHRRILCVADDEKIFTKSERVRGYSDTMRKAKLPRELCTVGPLSISLSEQLDYVFGSSTPPTAVFATSDVLAVRMLHELQRRRLRIPKDIALISFDDFDAATLVTPTITAVQQPVVELARRAARQLLERMDDRTLSSPPNQIVLPTQLILRDSCGCRTK